MSGLFYENKIVVVSLSNQKTNNKLPSYFSKDETKQLNITIKPYTV
jgi:hypothetical protein